LDYLSVKDIVLTTINAKWIHPSLALRLLKANLGSLEDRCEILEFNLRQMLAEKTQPLLDAKPRILGISVSIWNHLATIELLKELEKSWLLKPFVVLGGPEVSHLPQDAEIFKYADYVIRGEGETAFRQLCEEILSSGNYINRADTQRPGKHITGSQIKLNEIKSAYHLYTDEDLQKKLIYVESCRGCPFDCEFCLSSVKEESGAVRDFDIDQFLAQMELLIRRGAKTFKFLDRSFNINIPRSLQIIEFFLEKINNYSRFPVPFVVHFEMIPSNFPPELIEALARFPPGTLRLEIGIQTLNAETASLINLCGGKERRDDPQKLLETLSALRKKTNAIIHADLIAGLPGESLESFGEGFDRLWLALCDTNTTKAVCKDEAAVTVKVTGAEIQLGILKLLPGAPVTRHIEKYKMHFDETPPYEIKETSSVCADDLSRIKNFARFWELIVNRGLLPDWKVKEMFGKESVFRKFMTLSDKLLAYFGKNWGIDKNELNVKLKNDFLF